MKGERLGIEEMARDFGDPNMFLTLSSDPRSTYDTRVLLYRLENGAEMPLDHPYKLDTECFTDLINRYAPQMAIYLCRNTKMFLKEESVTSVEYQSKNLKPKRRLLLGKGGIQYTSIREGSLFESRTYLWSRYWYLRICFALI